LRIRDPDTFHPADSAENAIVLIPLELLARAYEVRMG
jgi:hypothetical protein